MDAGVAAEAGRPAQRPFVLAAFFEGRPTDGGSYVHKIGTLRVLRRMQGPDLSIVVVCGSRDSLKIVQQEGLRGVLQPRKGLRRLLGELSAIRAVRAHLGRSLGPRLSPVDGLLTRLNVDLAFFPVADGMALQLYTHSYIISVLDLAHVEHPEFAEVSHHGEFERRERLYGDAMRKAIAIIVDSEHGRRLVAEQYRIPLTRLFAAPFLTSRSVEQFVPDQAAAAAVRERYGLADPYIFYPAQFWAHKNHRYIVAALSIMRQRHGWAPQAVFCGSDKGMLRPVLEYASSSGVGDLVKYCGFVPEEHLPYLYTGALALVMPTYLGPTNIPPVEALRLGVPVCYSDLPSFREHLGDAATYVDLDNPASLADALHRIRRDGRRSCAGATDTRPARGDDPEDAYLRVLQQIVRHFRYKTGFDVAGSVARS